MEILRIIADTLTLILKLTYVSYFCVYLSEMKFYITNNVHCIRKTFEIILYENFLCV